MLFKGISKLQQFVDKIGFFVRKGFFRINRSRIGRGYIEQNIKFICMGLICRSGDWGLLGRCLLEAGLALHRLIGGCPPVIFLGIDLGGFIQLCTSFKRTKIFFRQRYLLGGNFLDSSADIIFYSKYFFCAAVFVLRQLAEGFFNLPLLVPMDTGLGKFSFRHDFPPVGPVSKV